MLCAILSASPAAAAISAATAADVCPPAANPCTITQQVDVAPGATLDFGTRAVVVSGSGQINAGRGVIRVLSGSFTASTGTSAAINIKNNGIGGDVTIVARKVCSADASLPCLNDAQCNEVGAGICSGGTGEVTLGGKVTGQAESPGSLSVLAVGDVHLTQLINVAGTIADSDGGEIDLESVEGSVVLDGKIQATSGGLGEGGSVTLTAGQKIVINQILDVTGGDFDGGTVDIFAFDDVEIHADVLASSQGGEGFGGAIDVLAEGDLIISGGTSSDRLVLTANGNSLAIDNSGGDGGEHCYEADGSITVSEFVRFESNGAPPDGDGDTVDFDAGGTLSFAGAVQAKARGGDGAGGFVDLVSEEQMDVLPTASFDLTGTGAGAGEFTALSSAGLSFQGTLTNVASGGGPGGDSYLEASDTLALSGSILSGGDGIANFGAAVDLDACTLQIKAGSLISNNETNAATTLTGHGTISTEAGSSISATGTGASNVFVYRDPAHPPTVAGIVSPAPVQIVNDSLRACPGCGNGAREKGETCDDGNLVSGDGCSNECQDEGCIADTPGYPSVALCDDQSGCTIDRCNVTTHSCIHASTCDDRIGCTVDTCVAGVCHFTADDTRCNDGNECTDDMCAPALGCPVSFNTDPCNDGISCTLGDQCADGTCAGVPSCSDGEVCNFTSGTCEIVSTTTSSTSTTTTTLTTSTTSSTSSTTTTLSGMSVCGDGLVESGESCDEGVNNGTMGQPCDSTCNIVECGDPNDSGTISASDALFVLKAAVGASSCAPCVCDAISSGGGAITASDALAVLRISVGVVVPLSCPVCF